MKKLSHTGCIDLVSPQCESAYDYQEEFLLRPIVFTNIIILLLLLLLFHDPIAINAGKHLP